MSRANCLLFQIIANSSYPFTDGRLIEIAYLFAYLDQRISESIPVRGFGQEENLLVNQI